MWSLTYYVRHAGKARGTTTTRHLENDEAKGNTSHIQIEGLRNWASNEAPCPECDAVPGNLHEYHCNDEEVPYSFRTNADYQAEVRRCTIHVTLTRDLAADLERALWLDARSDGNHGRCLKTKIDRAPHLELGDRLEITLEVLDVHVDLRTLPEGHLHCIDCSVMFIVFGILLGYVSSRFRS